MLVNLVRTIFFFFFLFLCFRCLLNEKRTLNECGCVECARYIYFFLCNIRREETVLFNIPKFLFLILYFRRLCVCVSRVITQCVCIHSCLCKTRKTASIKHHTPMGRKFIETLMICRIWCSKMGQEIACYLNAVFDNLSAASIIVKPFL